jgi:hypothetical protein
VQDALIGIVGKHGVELVRDAEARRGERELIQRHRSLGLGGAKSEVLGEEGG